ncbi:MAG: hypothetical protein JWM19_6281 [Actinomycetia bacterium]|nr:hypothetical protein [Actinomycetes bacterium]
MTTLPAEPVAAQAWHWVDPVAGAAKAAVVLRPGGRLAAVDAAGGTFTMS